MSFDGSRIFSTTSQNLPTIRLVRGNIRLSSIRLATDVLHAITPTRLSTFVCWAVPSKPAQTSFGKKALDRFLMSMSSSHNSILVLVLPPNPSITFLLSSLVSHFEWTNQKRWLLIRILFSFIGRGYAVT